MSTRDSGQWKRETRRRHASVTVTEVSQPLPPRAHIWQSPHFYPSLPWPTGRDNRSTVRIVPVIESEGYRKRVMSWLASRVEWPGRCDHHPGYTIQG